MNGRIYDGLLGRFLSADLLVSNPSSLQSFNRYSYVGNNPLSTTDPSGFESEQEKKDREQEEHRQARNRAIERWISGGGAPVWNSGAAASSATSSADQAQSVSTPASERVADAAPTPKQGDTIQTGDSPTPEPQSDVDPTSLAVASPMPGEIDTAIQVNAVVAPQITLQPLDVRTITEPLWRVTRRTGDMNSVVTDGKGGLKVRLHSQIGTYPPIVETAVKEHEELHRTTMLRQTPAFLNVWSTERAGYAIGPNDTNPTGKRNFRLNEIECHNLEIGILQNWLNDGSRSHNAADDAKVTRRISLLQTSLGTHQRELNALPASP